MFYNRRTWGTLGSKLGPVVAHPPDVVFPFNLWTWYLPEDAALDGGGKIGILDNHANPGVRFLLPSPGGAGMGIATAVSGLNGHDAFDFVTANNAALMLVGIDCSLLGKTQISTFAVVQMNSASMNYSRYFGVAPTNTSGDGDEPTGYLTVYRIATTAFWGARGITGTFPVTYGQYYRVAHIFDGTTASLYIDNVLFESHAWAPVFGGGGSSRLVFGAGLDAGAPSNTLWDGRIPEIFSVVDTTPTDDQRLSIDMYFREKYAL